MHSLSNPFFLALKAALSAALAYFLAVNLGIYDTLSAPFVALACTSPVVLTGLRQGLFQIIASAIGGLCALAVLVLLPDGALALGTAIFVTILAVHRLRLHDVFLVAGFTVIYAYLLPDTQADFAVEHRMFSVVAGVVSATVVNTVVSAWSYRSIFLRRRTLVRRLVGDALARVRDAAGHEPSRGQAGDAFDEVFPVLWALGAELGDASREGRWRRPIQTQLVEINETVRLLALLSHLGKELGLQVAASEQHALQMQPHLAALSTMFEGGERAGPPPREFEWAGAVRRAMETIEALLEAEKKLDVVAQ